MQVTTCLNLPLTQGDEPFAHVGLSPPFPFVPSHGHFHTLATRELLRAAFSLFPCKILFLSFSFSFWPRPQHVEVPESGIEPSPQQQPELLATVTMPEP